MRDGILSLVSTQLSKESLHFFEVDIDYTLSILLVSFHLIFLIPVEVPLSPFYMNMLRTGEVKET